MVHQFVVSAGGRPPEDREAQSRQIDEHVAFIVSISCLGELFLEHILRMFFPVLCEPHDIDWINERRTKK